MSDEVLVKVEGVRKKFCRSLKKSLWYGVCDMAGELNPFGGKAEILKTEKLKSISECQNVRMSECQDGVSDFKDALRPDEFWAVNDVSFELRRGECLGLIGHNGAGKTTLLKMLNGLIKPDHGRIEMRGRVGALIALGAGFNPLLTGRENVFVAGAVLGLSNNEIKGKYDDIVEFAGIREFMDTPVQNYSSGMQVRLGFSVASSINPDILLVDEVLAVGDIAFRQKCYERLGELRERAAVILVSHNMNHVGAICSGGILLDHGKSTAIMSVENVIANYLKMAPPGTNMGQDGFCKMLPPVLGGRVDLLSENITSGGLFRVRLFIECEQPAFGASLRIVFYTEGNTPIMDWWSKRVDEQIDLQAGWNELSLECGPVQLKSGIYFISFVVSDSTGIKPIYWSYLQYKMRVNGADIGSPMQLPKGHFMVMHPKSV